MNVSPVIFRLSVLIVLSLLLAACPAPAAPPAADTMAESSADTMDDVKIGLVTDVGRVNDRSFNQSAWEGVVAAAKNFTLPEENYKFIETQDAKDYADNIQQFIDADFNIIVSVGFALGDATIEAARNNPNTLFIGVDQFQRETIPNLTGLVFNEDHSGYLAGVLAANLSTSGIIAAVLGTDLVPPVVAFNEGYIAGAKSVNPDIQVISTYHPGEISQAFVDSEWGAATAKQALDQGADVIFGAGGITGNGALQEIATAEGAGETVFCIGVDTDQWNTVPAAQPCLVSSAMKLITAGIVDLVNLTQDDAFPGGNYFGGAGLAPFHDFEDMIPQELKDLLDTTKSGLEDGSVDTGYGN